MAGAQTLLAELAEQAGIESVMQAVCEGRTGPLVSDYIGYDSYVSKGGCELLRECQSGKRTVEDIISALEHSELRGLGGAGFPTGRKWRIVRGYEGPELWR